MTYSKRKAYSFNEPRVCVKCEELKPADDFAVRDPGRLRRRECTKCRTELAAIRYPNGRGPPAEAKKVWVKRNPEKRRAHIVLGNAVRDGKIKKPSACERCGSEENIHGHHHDYSKPLEVEWLCARCHRIEHAETEVTA